MLKISLSTAALFVLAWASLMTASFREYSLVRYWSARIESGQAPAGDALEKMTENRETSPRSVGCQSRFLKASLTLHLFALDMTKDKVDVSPKLDEMERILYRGLACIPVNGNAWLRLSMTSEMMFGVTELSVRFLRLSETYSPAERTIVSARCEIYKINKQYINVEDLQGSPADGLPLVCRSLS